jgi:hypothetical protein
MITAVDQWLAVAPNYLPNYTHTQQMIGTTILATLVVIAVVAVIIWHRRGQ